MHKLKSIFKKMALIAPVVLLFSCESEDVRTYRIELDPEVEAKVKQINMERFGGSWLVRGTKANIYFEIADDGYYWTVERNDREALHGDYGSIGHFKPGLMILYSDREDCPGKGKGEYLRMDQIGEETRFLDADDRSRFMPLIAVDKRERLDGLSCLD